MRNLRDIRVSTNIGNKSIPYEKISDFRSLTSVIGNVLLCKLHPFEFADSHILLLDLYSKQSIIGSSHTERVDGIGYKGPKWFSGFAITYAVVSVELFYRLSDNMQRHYALRIIYSALYKLCRKFQFGDIKKLNKTYTEILMAKFIIPSYRKMKLHKKTNIQAIVFCSQYLHYRDFYLQLVQGEEQSKKMYYLVRKEEVLPSARAKMSLDDKLKIPVTLEAKRWINPHTFLMCWGEEKVIFDIEQEKLIDESEIRKVKKVKK